MRVHLIAVQTELRAEAYASAEAFRGYVTGLCREAVAGLPAGEARVVAFPEALAVPLLFWLDTPPAVRAAETSLQAALRLLRERWLEALGLGVPSPAVFYHLRAGAVWPLYQEAFCQGAREAGAYVVAGSVFGPAMDWEPARRLHRAGRAAHNLSLVVSPQGAVLGRVAKVNLTRHERGAFLSGGSPQGLTVQTRLGTIANLICLDAFHDSLIERADAAGAWLVVQPSANAARWEGPWSADSGQVEGEVWLREGLAKKLRGRENLRYGLNPMLNGRLYDLHFEGRSGVYAAGKALSLAERPVGDAIVRAAVEVDGP